MAEITGTHVEEDNDLPSEELGAEGTYDIDTSDSDPFPELNEVLASTHDQALSADPFIDDSAQYGDSEGLDTRLDS